MTGGPLGLYGSLPSPLKVGFHLFWIALSIGAIATARDWFHKLVALIAAAGIAAYVALLFRRLPS